MENGKKQNEVAEQTTNQNGSIESSANQKSIMENMCAICKQIKEFKKEHQKRKNSKERVIRKANFKQEKEDYAQQKEEESNELYKDSIESCLANCKEQTQALAKVLSLTPIQVIILSVIVFERRIYGGIEEDSIAKALGMDYIDFFTYSENLTQLCDSGYLSCKRGEFELKAGVLRRLKENKPLIPERITGLDTIGILNCLKKRLNALKEYREEVDREEIDEQDNKEREFISQMQDILEKNQGNSFSLAVKRIIRILPNSEIILFYALIYLYWFEDNDIVAWREIMSYLEDSKVRQMQQFYRSKKLILQQKNIIEPSNFSSIFDMGSKDYFHIKDEIKDEIFKDVGGVVKKNEADVRAADRIAFEKIREKALFYNTSLTERVKELYSLFEERRLNSILASLKEKGFRTGFNCLFYGSPGTGKTETVYQIARSCKRDIYLIDMSQIKSCWVGESEQNIKRIFDEYRKSVEKSNCTPILLFNEADAIFGVRYVGAERSADKTMNSIQNIILQEMENLEGILIATTNLTENLDKAFERRFLYKVCFTAPDSSTKTKILKSMLPELSQEQAQTLAESFNLSGGQIENVARRITIASLLSGQEVAFEQIKEFCKEESIGDKSSGGSRKIGY